MTAIVQLLGGWRATAFAALLCVVLVFALVWRSNAAVARLQASKAQAQAKESSEELKAARAVIATERKRVEQANAIAAQYEKDKTDAEARADSLAADLRDGRVQLRKPWRCEAGVPATSASPGKPDGEAADRAESASRAIRAADEADALIRALQEFLRKERE